MLCHELSEVIDSSFHNQFMCQMFLTNFYCCHWDEQITRGKKRENIINHWYWESTQSKNCGIICHFQWRLCTFFVLSYSCFMRNCPWCFWWCVILIALYFEIKWEWQLHWLLLIWSIRHCSHLQPFSHGSLMKCHTMLAVSSCCCYFWFPWGRCWSME